MPSRFDVQYNLFSDLSCAVCQRTKPNYMLRMNCMSSSHTNSCFQSLHFWVGCYNCMNWNLFMFPGQKNKTMMKTNSFFSIPHVFLVAISKHIFQRFLNLYSSFDPWVCASLNIFCWNLYYWYKQSAYLFSGIIEGGSIIVISGVGLWG